MKRVILLATIALTACGGNGDDGGDPGGLALEAGAVVEELERSLANGEYDHVCNKLFSADVRRQAGGGDCPGMLERTSGGIERPAIEVKKIQIRGSVAIVDVITTAKGQAPAEDTIRLVREAGAYRISSLSG